MAFFPHLTHYFQIKLLAWGKLCQICANAALIPATKVGYRKKQSHTHTHTQSQNQSDLIFKKVLCHVFISAIYKALYTFLCGDGRATSSLAHF